MVDQILNLGHERAPEEACGLLVIEGRTFRLYHLANESLEPTKGYSMSPMSIGEAIQSQEEWDKRTTIWHTHPGGLVGPSEMDLRAMVDGCRYMVVTLPSGEVTYFGSEPIFRGSHAQTT